MHLDRVINYIKINYKIQNNQVKIEKGAGEGRGMPECSKGEVQQQHSRCLVCALICTW